MESADDLYQKVRKISVQQGRFDINAYFFVWEALDYTLKHVVKEVRHVKGRELLEGFRRAALEKFGPFARVVLRRWGTNRTEDIGEIVFSLVNAGLLRRSEEDSPEDFRNVFDFDKEFSIEKGAGGLEEQEN